MHRDTNDKFLIYQKYGVREYWIVHPNDRVINVFLLQDDNKYHLRGLYAGDDKIPVHIFNDELQIDLLEIFTEEEES